MKVFFDTEFTELRQDAKLISIGLIADDGRTFYAESNEYKREDLSDWHIENVYNHLKFNASNEIFVRTPASAAFNYHIKSNEATIGHTLREWLSPYKEVEMWSDCLAYDWVLFNNLYGTAFDIPYNIYYIPFDISTMFKLHGVDPDINREEFSGTEGIKHNAIHDAIVIRDCYHKLHKMGLSK